MDNEIRKSIVLDPERRNPFEANRNIICMRCKEQISEEALVEAFKINAGMSVDDTFFPERKSHYYHKECYNKPE